MKSHESAENYLETILILNNREQKPRSVDVAKELNFSRASVSIAMKNLKSDGYILIDENGFIELTEKGNEKAKSIYERHTLISDWLIFMGVDREIAVSDACKIEHGMSEQSFTAFKEHFENWKRDIYKPK